MTEPLFSRLPLDERVASGRVELRHDVRPLITSQAFDWPGMMLEAGRNHVAAVENLALSHHYVALNADSEPMQLLSVNEPNGRRDITLPPGSVWILPAGDAGSINLDTLYRYVRLTIDPRHVSGLLAHDPDAHRPVELRRAYGVDAPQLRHLMMALVAEADAGNPGGVAFVEVVAAAVTRQLAVHAGVVRPRLEPVRGGLSPNARRRVLELIDAKLDARLSIDTLAREVGLSPTHFARAFKETIGLPPHRFLLSRRLERARRMLEGPGARVSDVALRSGFADQAHFTRHFKRRFGVTPGALVRGRRP